MANGRDDRTKIDFTVSDRLMIQHIYDHVEQAINLEKTVIRQGTWIAAIRWTVGGGALVVCLKVFGVF